MVVKFWAAFSVFLFCFLFLFSAGFFGGHISLYQDFLSVFQEGEEYLSEGNFTKAISSYEESLNLALGTHNELIQAKCYSRLGLLYWNIGQLEKSLEFYVKALALAKKLNDKFMADECDSAIKIYNLYSDGKKYRRERDYSKSIKSYEEAIQLARKIESPAHELKCLRLLSITYWEMSDLENFFRLNEQGLKIAERLNHKREVGKTLNNLGLCYSKRNRYSISLSNYLKALEIARSLNDNVDVSAYLNNIATIYMYVGLFQRSLDYSSESYRINKQLGNSVYIAMDLNNIGETHRRIALISGAKEEYYLALENFKKSFDLSKNAENIRTEIVVLNNIGNVYIDLSEFQEALIFLQKGLNKVRKIYDYESEGMLLNNMGIAYLNLGNIETAKKYFRQAIDLAERIGARNILWEAFFGLAKSCERRNEYSQAITHYKKAIRVIEKVRSLIALDINKAGFTQNKLQVYEGLMNLLYKISRRDSSNTDSQEVFYIAERAKARAFLDMLAESRIDISSKLSSSIRDEEQAITERISGYMQELSQIELAREVREGIKKKLLQAEDEYMALISRMRIETPEIAGLVLPEPVRLDQLQEWLDNHTALIEYHVGREQSYVFYISKESFKVSLLPAREEIHKSLQAFLKLLSEPPDVKFLGEAAARRLYLELLAPVGKDIPESITNLVIIPGGALYYLPFEVLVPSASDKFPGAEYLISRYSISYSPSASSLLLLSGKTVKEEKSKDILALGNPLYAKEFPHDQSKRVTPASILMELYENLGFDFSPIPYSAREVKKIASFFPKNRRDILLKNQASEQILNEIPLDQYRIVHFACHSFLDEQFPSRSALVLSFEDEGIEDGFLQVREIYNLRLDAELVVLSACQTGKGKLTRGEGILGLPRIFFYTGARSVVSTLWKIGDKPTARFMEMFYRYLSKGESKTQALRRAKLKMLKTRYSHPFYWGAFVLNGEYRAAIFSQ